MPEEYIQVVVIKVPVKQAKEVIGAIVGNENPSASQFLLEEPEPRHLSALPPASPAQPILMPPVQPQALLAPATVIPDEQPHYEQKVQRRNFSLGLLLFASAIFALVFVASSIIFASQQPLVVTEAEEAEKTEEAEQTERVEESDSDGKFKQIRNFFFGSRDDGVQQQQ